VSKGYQKSNKIFNDNIRWLLTSDIMIKNGENSGALYGWKNLNPISFPFIYSEITGYAISAYSWIYSQLDNLVALNAAKQSSRWIKRNMNSYLLHARPGGPGKEPNDLSNLFYAFDNGMVMIGLLNLYKVTRKPNLLVLAENMARNLIKRFFDGTKLIARLDNSYKPITANNNKNKTVKWSTLSGAYHCKLSIGLLELSRLTNNGLYSKVSDSLCEYTIKLQRPNGSFITNPASDITYLHPHLYACEGLIHSGLKQSNKIHCEAGINGIKWAIEQTKLASGGGLVRDSGEGSPEQSDCTAQLLRLMVICGPQLRKSCSDYNLEDVIEKLHSRLLDFYVPTGDDRGGMKYQLTLDSACSWCTMFSMQALGLLNLKNSRKPTWPDYFI
jgi:hypothetical protein